MSDNCLRLDKALVARGLARSRTEAQSLIAAGLVTVEGREAEKSSMPIMPGSRIVIQRPDVSYVSRGGIKLAGAISRFQVAVADRRCLDVGASTGGFTDCLLQHGAAQVTAIDVGHGQMDESLRCDARVELREGVNARAVTPSDFPQRFALIVVDLSFISLRLVLPALSDLLDTSGDMICLVKPQFEVGPDHLGKGGIVRDAGARARALEQVAQTAAAYGLAEQGRMASPIAGGDGNEEYLIWFRQEGSPALSNSPANE